MKSNSFRTIGSFLIVLLWAVVIIPIYYVIHNPWGPSQLTLLIKLVLDFIGAAAVSLLAGGLGRRVGGVLSPVQPLERLALHAALGLGLLSLVALLLGLLGLLSGWILWILLCVGLIVLWREVIAWMKDWCALWIDLSAQSWFEWLALSFSFLIIILNLIVALAPPLAWDSIVYHLELPKQYLQASRVFFFSENLYAGFPQVSEMLFTYAMGLSSANAAVILGWIVGLIALIAVEGLTRRVVGGKVHWLAVAILLSGISISSALSSAYVGMWGILFSAAAIIALDYHRMMAKRSWLVWAGLMIGFAIGTKYTNGTFLLAGGIVLLPVWDNVIARKLPSLNGGTSYFSLGRLGNYLVEIGIMGFVAFLTFSPWLFKNFLLAGNPLYPILSSESTLDPWQQTFRGEAGEGFWEIRNS